MNLADICILYPPGFLPAWLSIARVRRLLDVVVFLSVAIIMLLLLCNRFSGKDYSKYDSEKGYNSWDSNLFTE